MRARPLASRLLAAALLAGMALWRATVPDGRAPPDSGAAPLMPTAAPRTPASTVANAAHLRADITTILARPLFRDGRRPPPAAHGAGDAVATADGLPRLSGILFDGATGAAIFEGAGKPRVTHVGDRIGPNVVAAITPTHVVLNGPDGERRLRPTYSAHAAPVADTVHPSVPSLLDQLMHRERHLPVPPPPTLGELRSRHGPGPAR